MNLNDLIAHIKSAVANRDAASLKVLANDFLRIALDYLSTPVTTGAADGPTLAAACDDLKAECDKALAVPQAGGLWIGIVLNVIKLIADGLSNSKK